MAYLLLNCNATKLLYLRSILEFVVNLGKIRNLALSPSIILREINQYLYTAFTCLLSAEYVIAECVISDYLF